VLCTTDIAQSTGFWTTWFDFTTTFEADWYVSLERRVGERSYELGLVAADHPTVPNGYRTPASGLLINVEVDDVDDQWRRLTIDGGPQVELPLRTEDFGQRHFIVAGPTAFSSTSSPTCRPPPSTATSTTDHGSDPSSSPPTCRTPDQRATRPSRERSPPG
jgi:hypothetical protein